MQKFILSIFCSIFSLLLFAQQPKSNLTISSTSNNNIRITLNGYKYTLQDRSTTFQALQPGNYPLVIFQWKNSWRGGGQYEKVYDANIRLTAGKHLEMTVMRFGKTSWDESNIEPDSWNEHYNNPPVSEGNGNPVGNNYNNNNNYREPVDATRFAAIKKAISNEFFDDDKIRMAKVTMKDNYFSTAQIKELVNQVSNDEKKLQLAKYAYDFCTDKGMYFTIAETMFFSNNKKALLDFIAGK